MAQPQIPVTLLIEAADMVMDHGSRARQMIIDQIVRDIRDKTDRRTLVEYEMLFNAVSALLEDQRACQNRREMPA